MPCMWEIMDTTLAGMYLVSLWEGLGLGMQNSIAFHLHCGRNDTGRDGPPSTAQDVLKEHSTISRILDASISQHNYRVRPSKEPHSITPSIFSTEPHGRARAASISLPSSDISPMCQFPPRTRASQDTRSQQKRNAQRTLPAASRRARVPPRTRIVGAFGEVGSKLNNGAGDRDCRPCPCALACLFGRFLTSSASHISRVGHRHIIGAQVPGFFQGVLKFRVSQRRIPVLIFGGMDFNGSALHHKTDAATDNKRR